MAKPKSEPTKTALALDDAKQKLEVAEKNNTAKPTDATAKAVDAAKEVVKNAQAADNREKFVRIGAGRVKKARSIIANIGNLAAPRSYSYSTSDIDLIEKGLNEVTAKTITKLRNALEKGATVAKTEDNFTFA